MKTQDLKKYREKNVTEMEKDLAKRELEVAKAYSERKAGKDQDLKKVKNLRHEIAQIKTLINEAKIVEGEKKAK